MADGKKIVAAFGEYERQLKVGLEELVLGAAAYAMALVRQRVAQGIGSNDQPMPPYTPEYAERKQKSGRRVDIRDLTWTGRMLGGIYVRKTSDTTAQVTFADPRSKALAQKNEKIAPWWGLSPADVGKLSDWVRKQLSRFVEPEDVE